MSAQTINKIPHFKAELMNIPINNDRRQIPPMPENYYEDTFELEPMSYANSSIRKVEKREKSRDNWNKAGIIASCSLALTMMATAAFAALALFKKGSGNDAYTTAKVVWEDFKGKKSVADLDSETTAKSLKDALNKIIKNSKLGEKARNWGGSPQEKVDIMYLYGHGGVGKTYVAKQYAQKIDAMFTCIKYPDLGSPYKDAASMKISNMFDQIIEEAKKNKDRKIVVCIDEIDAVMRKVNDTANGAEEMAKSRAAVLTGLDRIKEKCSNVTVIATSNYHPQNGIIDPIALRRFNNKIEVPLPNKEQISGLLEMYLKDIGAINSKEFVKKSDCKSFMKTLEKEGYSNGEIELIAKEAAKIFSSSLEKVAESDLSKHSFKVEYLEEAKKMIGEPASKTNKLMDVAKDSKNDVNQKPSFWSWVAARIAYALKGGK